MQSEYDDEQDGEEELGNEQTAKQLARKQAELDQHRLIQGNTPTPDGPIGPDPHAKNQPLHQVDQVESFSIPPSEASMLEPDKSMQNMSGWQMPAIAQKNDRSMQLPVGDDTMNSFNAGKYTEADVMQ